MVNSVEIPVLFIVGAGPGDPELITLKGIKAIKAADVVLYDALASEKLLEYAKPTCKMVYVGKRRGNRAFSQEEINQLIVFYASNHSCIVRLKGGDPFVFGRGHEEMDYALKRGMRVEIIPGVTSALAGPASVGIPLTKRGINESFWVITGTLASGDISKDLYLAAQSTATVIVLMGMSQLARIMTIFKDARNDNEPVAIIQWATLPNQRSVSGTVSTIQQIVLDQDIDSPAVIVIGKVVKESLLREQVQCIFEQPVLKVAV